MQWTPSDRCAVLPRTVFLLAICSIHLHKHCPILGLFMCEYEWYAHLLQCFVDSDDLGNVTFVSTCSLTCGARMHGHVQVAEKFLERDELASMSFQNDFLTPFVVVMRQSGAKEIRELIIRQASRMVLSRVSNIKSGWKSMFMVRVMAHLLCKAVRTA